MIRRDFLKSLGAITAGAAIGVPSLGKPVLGESRLFPDDEKGVASLNDLDLPIRPLKPVVDKPVTVVVIGAGSRGKTYARYAKKFPEGMQVVGVSDILDFRCNKLADQHGVAPEHRFGDWSEVFKVPKFADAVLICTPDDTHYAPCMKAIEAGYHVLLEKPVAPTVKECKAIVAQAHKYNRIVAVCHVLRYAP